MSQAIRAEQAHTTPDFNPSLQHGSNSQERHLFIVNSHGETDQVNLPTQTVFIGDSRGQVDAKVVPLFPESYPALNTDSDSPETNSAIDLELSNVTVKNENKIAGDKTQPWSERVKIYAEGQRVLDKLLSNPKYKLTDDEREVQKKFVLQRRADRANDEIPVTKEDVDYFWRTPNEEESLNSRYSAFSQILKEDLADQQATPYRINTERPSAPNSVEMHSAAGYSHSNQGKNDVDQQREAFREFFAAPEEASEKERFEMLHKLGIYLVSRWKKTNEIFKEAPGYDELKTAKTPNKQVSDTSKLTSNDSSDQGSDKEALPKDGWKEFLSDPEDLLDDSKSSIRQKLGSQIVKLSGRVKSSGRIKDLQELTRNLRRVSIEKTDHMPNFNDRRQAELLDIPSALAPKGNRVEKIHINEQFNNGDAIYIPSPDGHFQKRIVVGVPFENKAINDGEETVLVASSNGAVHELITVKELRERAKISERQRAEVEAAEERQFSQKRAA